MLSHGADLPACAALAAVQGLTVGLSGPRGFPDGGRCPAWVAAAVIPCAFVGMVAVLASDPHAADTIARLACFAVPLLAAVALWRLTARPAAIGAVLPLLELAVVERDALTGQLATVALLALSCVTLGAVVVRLGSIQALLAGIALLVLADVTLMADGDVQVASAALVNADLGSLPSFSQAVIGQFTMGYGDLCAAAIAGALAARAQSSAWRVGALTLVLVLLEGALLSDRGPYPATVPVFLALALDALWRRRTAVAVRGAVRSTSCEPAS